MAGFPNRKKRTRKNFGENPKGKAEGLRVRRATGQANQQQDQPRHRTDAGSPAQLHLLSRTKDKRRDWTVGLIMGEGHVTSSRGWAQES